MEDAGRERHLHIGLLEDIDKMLDRHRDAADG